MNGAPGPFPLLLDFAFIGLLCNGLRPPWLWSAAAALLWLAALRFPPKPGLVSPFWWVWCAWAAASALLSPEPLLSLPAFCRLAAPLALFSAAAGRFDETARRAWLLRLAVSAPALALAAAYVSLPSYSDTGLLPPYYNYTSCALSCAYAACLSACLATREKNRSEDEAVRSAQPWDRGTRLALAGAALCALAAVVAAQSRGALFGCATATAFVLLRARRGRLLLASALLAVALGAVAFPGASRGFLKLDLPSAAVRPRIWRSALAVAAQHPFFGTGPGRFERGFLLHRFPSPAGYATRYGLRTAHAHSELLQSAAETGVAATLFLLLALAATLLRAGRKAPPPPAGGGALREAALASCAAMLAQALVDNVFALPALGLLFAASLAAALPAIAATPPAQAEPCGETSPSNKTRLWRGLCILLATASALSWGPSWLLHARTERTKLARTEGINAALSALDIAPQDDFLWALLARTLLRNDSGVLPQDRRPGTGFALRALEEAERLSPTNALHPLLKAEILRRAGDWPGVLSAATRASQLEPDSPQARLLCAHALARMGRAEESRAALAQARRLAFLPQALRLRANQGRSYDQLVLFVDEELLRSEVESLSFSKDRHGEKAQRLNP